MTINFDYEKCIKCKKCYELCPLDIITWENDVPKIKYPNECQICFICQAECPTKAIKLKIPIAFW
ncbi:4Fe-4S dicluster domain-containing protein [Candidatus Bathyarchaeota archaeon]|nr:4Fe-4S dicluster domain-containing protein [Candidatus Bathyarchaeota archaeon]